jgi:3-hydroxyacyl-CoA dehydrogenase
MSDEHRRAIFIIGKCRSARQQIVLTVKSIWAAIKREALLTVAEDVATPAEIDAIFKEVLKTPKGPCEQMDVVGLDVVLDIEEHYAAKREGLPTAPRELLKRMIAEGKLGVKNGSGFYSYDR